MNTKNYSLHTAFLTALAVLGNSAIMLPILSGQNTVTGLLLCAALTAVTAIAFIPVIKNARGAVFYVVGTAVILISFYGAASAFADYIKLLSGNKILSAVLLFVLIAALTVCKISAFLKFSLLFGVITTALIILLFVMPIVDYDISNIKLLPLSLDVKSTAATALKYFSPALSAVMLITLADKKIKIKNTVFGVFGGFVLLALCLLQTVLMLGKTAAYYDTPYLAAVSAYSSGQLYIRQDGFAWFVLFAASVIKISLCTKTVWLILKNRPR